jgi:hypothetical protein
MRFCYHACGAQQPCHTVTVLALVIIEKASVKLPLPFRDIPSSYPANASWYLETGATDHLTSQVDKLATREFYHGHDKVYTANGAGMHISHIGQTSLLNHTSKQLHLTNVLQVPSIALNLLSVCKFTCDNNIFVEFHPSDFLLETGKLGKFFLVVIAAMVYMNLMCHLPPKSLVVLVFRCHSGTLALVIQRLPSLVMLSIVMSSLYNLVVIMLHL